MTNYVIALRRCEHLEVETPVERDPDTIYFALGDWGMKMRYATSSSNYSGGGDVCGFQSPLKVELTSMFDSECSASDTLPVIDPQYYWPTFRLWDYMCSEAVGAGKFVWYPGCCFQRFALTGEPGDFSRTLSEFGMICAFWRDETKIESWATPGIPRSYVGATVHDGDERRPDFVVYIRLLDPPYTYNVDGFMLMKFDVSVMDGAKCGNLVADYASSMDGCAWNTSANLAILLRFISIASQGQFNLALQHERTKPLYFEYNSALSSISNACVPLFNDRNMTSLFQITEKQNTIPSSQNQRSKQESKPVTKSEPSKVRE